MLYTRKQILFSKADKYEIVYRYSEAQKWCGFVKYFTQKNFAEHTYTVTEQLPAYLTLFESEDSVLQAGEQLAENHWRITAHGNV